MSLLTILFAIIVAGVVCYIINLLPISQLWKALAYGLVALGFLWWLFNILKGAGIDLKI